MTSRTYYESQGKSIYTVREDLGDRRQSPSASERSESRSASGEGGVGGVGGPRDG